MKRSWRDRAASSRLVTLGAAALMVRPAYIATEFIAGAAATGDYSFAADSISRLGEVGCSPEQCSPRHAVMNGSFITFGALLAGGSAALTRSLGPWATGLLVVSGLSSIATGLAPLDQDTTLHAMAATPLFIAQPIALIVLGVRLRSDRPRLSRALLTTGAVTATAGLGFVLASDSPVAGALERLALWPVLFGVAAVAWTATRPASEVPAAHVSKIGAPDPPS